MVPETDMLCLSLSQFFIVLLIILLVELILLILFFVYTEQVRVEMHLPLIYGLCSSYDVNPESYTKQKPD